MWIRIRCWNAKMTSRIIKLWRTFVSWRDGCSLWRSEGFSWICKSSWTSVFNHHNLNFFSKVILSISGLQKLDRDPDSANSDVHFFCTRGPFCVIQFWNDIWILIWSIFEGNVYVYNFHYFFLSIFQYKKKIWKTNVFAWLIIVRPLPSAREYAF
jgi:hypothetical protein